MADAGIDKKNGGLFAVAMTAWALVLIAPFLWHRGEDVGRLPTLLGTTGGGAIFGPGIVDSVIGVLVGSVILVSWFGVGNVIVSRFVLPRAGSHSHILELAIATAVGAAFWSLTWYFLGLAGVYYAPVAVGAVVVGAGLAITGWRKAAEIKAESRVPERPSRFDLFSLVVIAIPVVLALIASLAPPTAKDTLLYHFALPKAFIAQHGNAFVEGNIASYLALGGEMHNVWAMLLGGIYGWRAGEAAAGAVNFLFFPLTLAAVFGWTREIGIDRRLALVAVLMIATVPTAYHVAAGAYIDLSLALYTTLAIYTLSRWWKQTDTGWLVLLAIFLGAALSIKLTSLFIFAAAALVIVLRARKAKSNGESDGRILAFGLGALLLAGAIASPWYLRTWKETGSPFFPFYLSIWKGEAPGWDVERSNLFQGMNARYGGENKTTADYLLSPWNVSVNAQPEQAGFFDGVIGVAFLFGLPLLVWALWKFELPIDVKIGAGVAGIVFLFWLSSSQQVRYLLPILPLLAIGMVASIRAIRNADLEMVARLSLVAAGIVGILTTAAWFLQIEPVRVVFGGETREQYLARNLDHYPYYQWLNAETQPTDRIWLINMRRDTYDLDRPAYSDYLFEDWTLRKMLWETRSLSELRTRAVALNVQYILARHDFLFDYDRSSLVDDSRPRAENEAKLKMARDLILDRSRTIKADDKFSLIKVF